MINNMKNLRITAAILTCVTLFALCGCAEQKSNFWKVTTTTYEDGSIAEKYVQLNFSPENEYEVWVNLSDLEKDECVVSVAAGYSTTVNSKKNSVTVTKDLLKATDGWVRLITGVSSSYAYVDVYTKNALNINEVIVCSVEEGKVFKCSFVLAGSRISQSSSSNRHEYTEEELAEMKTGPDKVCDEQDMEFDRATIAAAFNAAALSASTSASK